MRKHKHLVWVIGLALALTVAAVAWANGTQSIYWSLKPSKLSKTTYGPVKLSFTTQLVPQTLPPADQPLSDIKLTFPKDIKFNAKGITQCPVSTIMSGHKCPKKSILGKGTSASYSKFGNITPPVTAYNGVTSAKGTPTIVLAGPFPPSPGPIVGTMSKKTGGTIDFAIPAFGMGAANLTSLTVTFTKLGYVSARCSTKKLTLKSVFTYAVPGTAGAPSQSQSPTIKCSQS